MVTPLLVKDWAYALQLIADGYRLSGVSQRPGIDGARYYYLKEPHAVEAEAKTIQRHVRLSEEPERYSGT